MNRLLAIALILLCSTAANALPLEWRADWPDCKPVEKYVHRGTDIELQPTWYINGELADTTNWSYQVFVQTNNQATGSWFGPIAGTTFSHTNDVGAAMYQVMLRAQTPGGAVNYTAFARLRMLDSPGFTPGALPLPVSSIDFSQVVALNAPWLLPGATNDIASIKVELGSISNGVSTLSAATATNSAAISTLSNTTATINSKIPSAASASNQLADKEWIDDEIDTYAAYYITYTAAGAAFPTRAALLNATVVYSGGVARTPTRNDYAVVLADESHGGAEWRYIYTVAAGATSGQWDAQYPIETNDYDALANKPQINGVSLTGNKTGADLGLATPANVAAAALAATNYTEAAAALKSRTALGDFVTSPSTYVDGEETYTSQIPYWDDSGSGGAGWYVYNDGFSENEFLSDNPNATILTWSASMIYYHEFVATRQTVVIPGYILGAQTNKPLASAEMAATNSTAIASLTATVASVAQAATNYTDASISASSPAFSNAVLSVGLGIDTNTVAVINELVDSAHDLPVSGATSVGALLLALAAAVAALKKNLRYSYHAATVTLSTTTDTNDTATVTNVADRAINTATLGSSVTAATVTLPAATTGRARDFFIDLTIEATTAPTLTFIDPATGTTINVAVGADSLADIDTGKNAVLFTEFPNHTWLVSVKHEEAAS